MPNLSSTAHSKFYIGPASTSTPADEDGYLNTTDASGNTVARVYTEVIGTTDLGEFGAEGKELTSAHVDDGLVYKLKGSIDNGSLEIICDRDPSDPGQIAMRAAAATWDNYLFKIVLNDKPTGGTQASTYCFRGPVLSAKNTLKGADDITQTTFKISISGDIIEVLAA